MLGPVDPDPAPVRFLPEFDNLMLAYTHRIRMMSEEDHRRVGATWAITSRGHTALLTVQPFRRLNRTDCAAIADEGARLLDFAATDVDAHDLRILPPY